MKMPLVTIIIPVYNTEKYLRKCLDSVVNQTYKNIEIIVINDASTDQSLNILKSYASIYKNIQIINNQFNLGVGASRNKGLQETNGEYIYFLDSDDEITYNAIERLVNLSLSYNSPLVEASHALIRPIFRTIEQPNKTTAIEQIDIEKNKEYLCSQGGAIWNKLFAHSLLEKERFPENLIFEDAAFLFPLLTKVKKSIKTNEILYHYYKHQNSIINSMRIHPNSKILDMFAIYKRIQQKCQKSGTYREYEKVLQELFKEKYVYVLLEINTWVPLGIKNHMLLLNYLKQQIEQEFEYDSLFSTAIVKARREQNPFYQAKIALLNEHLKLAEALYPTLSYEPLEDAKRIIARYKKR